MLVRSAAKLTAPSPETDFLDIDIIEFTSCDMAYQKKPSAEAVYTSRSTAIPVEGNVPRLRIRVMGLPRLLSTPVNTF